MKLVIYTLNENGTVPDFIVDGGYLPVLNENKSPQNYNLIGISEDDSYENAFMNENSLVSYISESGLSFTDPDTNEVIPIEEIANSIWNKLLQYES
jgi:hypothetical protein